MTALTTKLFEEELDRLPDLAAAAGGADRLTQMLGEDGEHFAGLSVEETDWMRGHIYAAIALSDAPEKCLPRAREDLRTSVSLCVLAGIARVLQAARVGADWRGDVEAARDRIQLADQYPEFRFDPARSACCGARTSVQELEACLAAMPTSCCAGGGRAVDATPEAIATPPAAFFSAELQDQDGETTTFAKLIADRPVLLALFYTRCMNPLKCSQTISRLARCARAEPGLRYVGMSYDPEYDTPYRLRVYGEERGMPFGEDARLVRCANCWQAIRDRLELRAGYGTSTVNSHARELFLLDVERRLWRIPPDWLLEVEKVVSFNRHVEPGG